SCPNTHITRGKHRYRQSFEQSLSVWGEGVMERILSCCVAERRRRGDHTLADASLDRRHQNVYIEWYKGEALRTRGAPQTPDTRAARRGASVRGMQHSTRRDYHAVL